MRELIERLEQLTEARSYPRKGNELAKAIIDRGAKHPLFKGIEKEVSSTLAKLSKHYGKGGAGEPWPDEIASDLQRSLEPIMKKLGERGAGVLAALEMIYQSTFPSGGYRQLYHLEKDANKAMGKPAPDYYHRDAKGKKRIPQAPKSAFQKNIDRINAR